MPVSAAKPGEAAKLAIANGEALLDRVLGQHDCPGPCGGKVPDTQYACLDDFPSMGLELPNSRLAFFVTACLDCVGAGVLVDAEPHEVLRLLAELQHHRAVWARTAGVLAELLDREPDAKPPIKREILDAVTAVRALIDPTLEGVPE